MPKDAIFTERELLVARLKLQGLPGKKIAQLLDVSEASVSQTLHSVTDKIESTKNSIRLLKESGIILEDPKLQLTREAMRFIEPRLERAHVEQSRMANLMLPTERELFSDRRIYIADLQTPMITATKSEGQQPPSWRLEYVAETGTGAMEPTSILASVGAEPKYQKFGAIFRDVVITKPSRAAEQTHADEYVSEH